MIVRVQRLFVPIAFFALIVVGLHVGSDRLDDHLFVALNAIDAWVDAALAFAIKTAGGWIGASEGAIDAAAFRAADFVDLETKITLAKIGALAVELAAD